MDPSPQPQPDGTVRQQFISWAMRQGILAVLLLILVGMVGWVGHYAATSGIPSVVKQIQDGYERLDAQHAIERKELREDAKADRESFRSAFEKVSTALDRLSDKVDRGKQ